MSNAPGRLTLDAAETIAAQTLAFLAGDSARFSTFLALTGVTPDQVRMQAAEREFLAAVLEHLAGDESLLLVFAANTAIAPEVVARALALLREANGAIASP
jgi:hypothetical protein